VCKSQRFGDVADVRQSRERVFDRARQGHRAIVRLGYAPRKLADPPPKPKSTPPQDDGLKPPRILVGDHLSDHPSAMNDPSASIASWYLQRGRADPIGPFTTDEVREGLRLGEIPHDANAREVAETSWRPLSGIAEFRGAASGRASSADMDAERLAPVEGPKWSSRADRHIGRGGVGTSPLSSVAPVSGAAREPGTISQPPKKRPSIPSTAYESPPAGHRLVAASLAGLGAMWTLMRVVMLMKLPDGWVALVERHHALRAGALAEIAVGAVVWPLVLVGALASGRRRIVGIPLVRASAWAAVFCLVVVAVVVPVMISRDATWSIDPAKLFVAAVGSASPAMLAVCAAWVLRLFPEDEGGARLGSLGAIVVAVAGACVALSLYAWPDVVYVVGVGGEPAIVFTDAHAARDDGEGRKLGVAGMFERRRAQAASFAVPEASAARYLDETRFDLESGPVVVCAISIVDGSENGRVVYVSSEALRSRP
jgi:hypothetical protein